MYFPGMVKSILGSWDTLTGGCSVHVPIHVGMVRVSWDLWILRQGCAHPCTVSGWSEYLGISGYSDRGVQCVSPRMVTVYLRVLGYSDRGMQCACAHQCVLHVLGWSEHMLGSWDTLTWGRVVECPSMYCPGMVRVSWDLGIL